MKRGYIRLYRKIEDWAWFTDANTYRVFTYLLIHAYHKDAEFNDILIKRGSYATTYTRIADKLLITPKQVRTAIDHLKKSGEVSVLRHKKFLVITLTNYNKYQCHRAGSKSNKRQSKGKKKSNKSQQSNNYNKYNKKYNKYNYNNKGASYDLEAYDKYCFLDDPNSKCNIMLREEKTKRNE